MTTTETSADAAKTFGKRFNAQRAAKSALGKDAQEGAAFTTQKNDAGEWFWTATAVAATLPAPPDFSAKTHAPYRKKLAAVVALAEAGDVKALKAFHINPSSTSPKAIIRYRDKAIAALAA